MTELLSDLLSTAHLIVLELTSYTLQALLQKSEFHKPLMTQYVAAYIH